MLEVYFSLIIIKKINVTLKFLSCSIYAYSFSYLHENGLASLSGSSLETF